MGGWRTLRYVDRLRIETLKKAGLSVREIAMQIGCSAQTIYNEFRRGAYTHTYDYFDRTEYSPELSQRKHEELCGNRGPGLKIGNNLEVVRFLEREILGGSSPDVAVARLKKSPDFGGFAISTSTCYNYIRQGLFLNVSMGELPRRGRGRKKGKKRVIRAKRLNRNPGIESRPNISGREEFGHWEMDTVAGRREKGKCLLVLTERKTRYELVRLLNGKTAKDVVSALNSIEKSVGAAMFAKAFRTITCDNGPEFQDYAGMRKRRTSPGTRTAIYYCHPYSAFERGSNENANLLIRRFFPKGKSLTNAKRKDVRHAQDFLNSYERRALGYRTPQELFAVEIQKLE